MKERPEGFDKLPKRFRDYAQQLENTVSRLRSEQPVKTPTDLEIENYERGAENRAYLPAKTRLRFTRGRHRFEVFATATGVEVRCETAALAVLPQAGNVVELIGKEHA